MTVAGVGVSGYNGTFPIVSVPSSTQFTYIAGASGLAASGGGTAASATATIQTAAAHGFIVGQLVTTTNIGVAGYNGTMGHMKTVKIGETEYRAIKAFAKKRGNLLQYVLTEAIRQYLAAQSKEQAGSQGGSPLVEKVA